MQAELPLAGLRVIEFSHMVMGPSAGLILGDLGADVIKIEPVGAGDNTRRLVGSGAGFFATFNRNKRSLALNLKSPKGLALARRLIARSDVMCENFRPGALEALGLGYDTLGPDCPRLVYCSFKGFLAGPYEHRTALDEVVQMMGGLAYMTGPPGRPLRAGTSVNDIMGGMFGAIGVLSALRERDQTGQGQEVQTALFENCVLLSAQHMVQYKALGVPPPPLPGRAGAWGIYDIFEGADGEQIFLGVVTDTQWPIFCKGFKLDHLLADERLKTNNQRVEARSWLLPELRQVLKGFTIKQLAERFETMGLPFAPIVRPEQLFDDPHLKASGGLAPLTDQEGTVIDVPLLPITMDRRRFPPRHPVPVPGEQTGCILSGLGYSEAEIAALAEKGAIGLGERG